MIEYTEFLAAALETQGRIEEERIAEAFDRLDCDHSGYISKANLRDFLGTKAESSQIDAIISEGDENNDGKSESTKSIDNDALPAAQLRD